MLLCSAVGCSNKAHKKCGISFFRFPLDDPDRLDQWVLNMRRQNWTPNSFNRLCSEHFQSDCFTKDLRGRTVLTSTAVPTIFSFTEEKTSDRPKQLSAAGNVADAENRSTVCVNASDRVVSPLVGDNVSCGEDVLCSRSIPAEDTKAKRVDHAYSKNTDASECDHAYFDSNESPRKINRKMQKLEDKYTEARKKLHLKERQTKRLKAKVMSLKEMTKVLQSKKLISSECAKKS